MRTRVKYFGVSIELTSTCYDYYQKNKEGIAKKKKQRLQEFKIKKRKNESQL